MVGVADWYAPTAGAIALVLAAALPAWLTVHRRLGKPNGGGTVVGEIALVKDEVRKATDAASQAANSAQIAASAATTAATAAQIAAAMAEANGNKTEDLTKRVASVEVELGLIPRKPF